MTLVTLDCRAFDIMKSVSETVPSVYSPAVLRLRGQPPAHYLTANSTANVKVARHIFERGPANTSGGRRGRDRVASAHRNLWTKT